MATPKKDVKPVFEYAQQLGFSKPELTGSDHWRFRHPQTGRSVTVAATPGDKRRFLVTAKADLRRAAGPAALAKLNDRQTKKGYISEARVPGSVQEAVLASLKAAEPDGRTAQQLRKCLGMGYPPWVALKALEKMGLVVSDKRVTPHVWRPIQEAPKKAAVPAPAPQPAPTPAEPSVKAPEAPAPVTVPTPAPTTERASEAATALLAEVVATFEVKMVRDTEGRYHLVLPFSIGGPK